MEDRFEDVPVEISDRDRYGKVKLTSYYDYYQSVLFMADSKDFLQPAGMTSENRNYMYRGTS